MKLIRLAALMVISALAIAAAHPNWTNTIAVTPAGSHVLGNPAAKVKLVEFVSYTCPHCAHFAQQSDVALRVQYVTPGAVSVEVRHIVRDPIDLSVALLTNCGPPSRFFRNHFLFMAGQDRWIGRARDATEAQQTRWSNGPLAQRMRAIAADFDFYALMEQRGYSRAEVDRCLADEGMARRLVAQTQAAGEAGINSTPSFMLDDAVLTGTHDWASLEPQIKARM